MQYRSFVALETLESRTLYSASPSPTIVADEAAVATAKAQRASDQSAGKQTLLTDKLQLLQDQSTKSSSVAPLVLQLNSDIVSQNAAILAAHEQSLTTRITDRTAVTNDFRQLAADDGNATAEAADHVQLLADQNKLGSDITANANALAVTRSTWRMTILNDRLAITNARTGDDPTINADKAKILSDTLAEKNTLLADQEAILSAELQLVKDRIAGA